MLIYKDKIYYKNMFEFIEKYSQFNKDDILYFSRDTANKVKELGLPKKDCIINDANEAERHRLYYCFNNCRFKCLA